MAREKHRTGNRQRRERPRFSIRRTHVPRSSRSLLALTPMGGGRRQRIAVAISIVPAENPARLSTAEPVSGSLCRYVPDGRRPLATSASAHSTHSAVSSDGSFCWCSLGPERRLYRPNPSLRVRPSTPEEDTLPVRGSCQTRFSESSK